MSDTPRTDAVEQEHCGTHTHWALLQHARQLERELQEARETSQKYEDRYFNLLGLFHRLLERNITFDGSRAILNFESHDQAINHIAEARRYGR